MPDSSAWIAFLQGRSGTRMSGSELAECATCGPVIQEVFQGLRYGSGGERFRDRFLALPVLSDPVPKGLYVAAADIYQQSRAKGYTIRSSVDCLIAAIAIENRVAVLHNDRDFETIARFTSLRTERLG